ncbi:tetratricopeptide repeat protein [Sphingomonas sp.]|uniref:DUF3857 domain-containing protein n=1 Tax=Sphingomonas sp. TaxID=28214 RepID=UPI002E371BCD|nr:tetratricopeptide repeat protein [Sphingomonas sp.]HEX4695971.1 tetratricopeptide repeat protein [Sphingomonas sp.]
MKIRLLLAAACVTLGDIVGVVPAHADDVLHVGKQPAWVVPVAAPAAKPADGAVTFRLADFQVRFDDKGMHQFVRQLIRVNTPAGLQVAGTVGLAWQPTLDLATVDRLVIHRGAETIDVLKDGKGFQILRRESELESAMTISGVLTAVMPLPDLRVGDEVEFAYSIDLANPVLAGHAEAMLPLTKMPAMDRMSVRYSWPLGRQMRWKTGPQLPPIVLARADGFQVMTMTRDGWTTPELPAGAPGRFSNGALVQAADFADWGSVAALMRPLYAKATTIGADSPVMAEVKRIAALSPDPKVRATEALRVVQSQVRYLARLDGLGGYVPESADAVWAAKSGDCKGKTVLLLAMLRALDVTAEPALVSATDGDGLDQSLPMPGRFNHVIVEATIGGQTYWLDGTRLGDRGVDTIAVPAFKWALPLDSAATGLTALAATEPAVPDSEDRLDLDARAGLAKPAKASGSIIYRGEMGSQMRIGLSVMSATDRDEMLRKIWSDRYSWITVKTADYRVDDKTGEVVFSFTGTATLDWSNTGADSIQRYVADNALLGRDLAPKRDKNPDAAPVAVDGGYTTSRETILLPDGGKGFAVEGEAFDRSYGGVRYVRDYSLKDGKFEMSATTRSRPGEISYADAKTADKQTDVLIKKALYITAPPTFGAPASEVATTAPVKPGDAAPDTGLAEVTRLALAGKNDEALKLLDTRIAGGDRTGKTLAMRGQVLRGLDRTDAASDAYDQALAADRREPLAITGKAEMLIAAGRDEDALILYDRLVLLWPEATEGYRRRAGVRAELGQIDGALSDLGIMIDKKPDDLDARASRTELYLQRGRGDDAVADARALVKLKPDDAAAHALLANVLAATGKRTEAIAETDKSIALKASGTPYRVRLRFGLEPDAKGLLADTVALIKYEPWSDLPLAPLKRVMGDPAARTAVLQAYDAALTEDPDSADSITSERNRAIAVGGDAKAYIAEIDAQLAKKPTDAAALNEACWARAWLKVELDAALAQCDKSIAGSRQAATFDSRGLVRLQRGEWDKAAADYGDAVALRPTMASSLYGRGIARKRLGDLAGSKADIAAATMLDSKVAESYAAYGLTP